MSSTAVDLTLTRSGELDVTSVEGNTSAGVEFVDAYLPREVKGLDEMLVVDSNLILVRDDDAVAEAALARGLTVERTLVSSERRR